MLVKVGEVEPVVACGVDEDLIGLPAGVQVESGHLAAGPRGDLRDDTGEHRGRCRRLLPACGDTESYQQTNRHGPTAHGGKPTPARSPCLNATSAARTIP